MTVVDNHARKKDGRRRTQTGEGPYRCTVHKTDAKPRIATGLTDLDALLGGGLRPGRLTVVGARTAMGKSMLALTFARHCGLRQRRPVQFVSLEMSHDDLMTRTIAAQTGILTEKFYRRTLSDEELTFLKAAGPALDGPLALGSTFTSPTVRDIRKDSTAIVGRFGSVDLLVVDYLGLMDGALGQRGSSRREEVAHIVADLVELAASLNAALVIVEQLGRATEFRGDHRPRVNDMEHADPLLQHAEAVVLLYRDAYYAPEHRLGRRYDRSPDPDLYPDYLFPRRGLPEPAVQPAELHVPHNRHGRTGIVHVQAELSRARFCDLQPNTAPLRSTSP